MAHNPGDTVYSISAIHLDGSTPHASVVLKFGVVDKAGKIAYRQTVISVDLADDLVASVRTAIAALVAAHLPAALAGAVPE